MALFSSTTKKHHAAAKLEGTDVPTKIVKAKKAPKAKAMETAITSPAVKAMPVVSSASAGADSSVPVSVPTSVIIGAHITEKSGIQSEASNIYTFKVTNLATKGSIRKAIKSQFKVTPVKVNITTRPAKTVNVRGRQATRSGFKKAVVFLKKGDKIEFA